MHTYLTSLLLVSGLAFGTATASAERLWTIGQNDNQATLPTDGAVQAELPDGERMKQLSYSV